MHGNLIQCWVLANRGGMLPYKVVVRYTDREETVEQFDLLDEVLDYLTTQMGHVFGRKNVIGILILKEDCSQEKTANT